MHRIRWAVKRTAVNTERATSEITLSGDTSVAFTNKKTVEESLRSTIRLSVTKNWGTISDDEKPNSITIKVNQYEKIVQSEAVIDPDTHAVITPEMSYLQINNWSMFANILKSQNWTATIDNLYKKSSRGNYYVYTVEEVDLPGFKLSGVRLDGTPVALGSEALISGETSTDHTLELTNQKVNTYDFTLKKTVTGNMGNREKKFVFSLRFENTAKDVDGIYEVWDSGVYVRQIAINFGHTDDFILSSGESLTIKGLPEGTRVTVEEVPDVEYKTQYKKDNDDAQDGYSASVELTDSNHTVEFINSRSAMLPTGITEHPIAAAAAGVLTILGIIILLIRRRRYA